MITLYCGNIGSGKTACAVREMANTPYKNYYSNIITKHIKNAKILSPDMIIQKTVIGKNKKGEDVNDFKLNVDFWKNTQKPISIILDEIHSILNSRRSMSKVNVIMTDWLALLRRMLGQTDAGEGELIVITQLTGRVDIILREMAHRIKYFTCHYIKSCRNCGVSWRENSEMPEQLGECPACGSWKIHKHDFVIEVKHFATISAFDAWHELGIKTYHRNYLITDIEKYFPYYDTLQWDNLFSEFY